MTIRKQFTYQGVLIEISEQNLKYQRNESVQSRLKTNKYEKEEITFLKKHISKDAKFLDLGGSLGVLSCVIANMLDDHSSMTVVEANPNLIDDLTNNRDINDFNFNIVHAAVSSDNREVDFNFDGHNLAGSIARKKHLESDKWGGYNRKKMKTITPIDIENLVKTKFDHLSCDIEGEELRLLPEMVDYFKNYKLMVVEFHNHNYDVKYKHTRKQIENIYSKYYKIERMGMTTCFYK
jgi:FkbM family methyltransferase